MENISESHFANDPAPAPKRPQFLKVLCILSFIACGIMILVGLLGTLCLGISEDKANAVWDKVIESQPHLENVNPMDFFQEIGKISALTLFANIASLVGVIMMWRLNKIGFYIYAVAEFLTYFFGMNINGGASEGKSYGGTIFMIVLDLAFIAMYAVNLKYMNKSNPNAALNPHP